MSIGGPDPGEKTPPPLLYRAVRAGLSASLSGDAGLTHYLRDYDNVEHRCVANALAALAMWGDSPDCIISLDVLAPGERDFTEICVMTMEKFREFVLSEKIEFQMG